VSQGLHSSRRLRPVPKPFVADDGPDYLAIQHSPEFVRLRRELRRLQFGCALLIVLPLAVVALVGGFRRSMLIAPVLGAINVGIALSGVALAWLLGLTAFYLWRFHVRIEPQINLVRHRAGLAAE
jgi:uncharacterized membrane protein (DUF485 family)